MMPIRFAIVALVSLLLASCGIDLGNPGQGVPQMATDSVQGFWQDARRPSQRYVFGASQVLWDSAFDKSLVGVTPFVAYRYEVAGTRLTLHRVAGLPSELAIKSFTGGGLTLEEGGRSTSLLRMSDADVERVFGRNYVGRPDAFLSDLRTRNFRPGSAVVAGE